MDVIEAYRANVTSAIKFADANDMITNNLPFVIHLAQKYARRKQQNSTVVSTDDLISAGNLALCRSVKKFKPSVGVKFSSYVCVAIYRAFDEVVAQAQNRGVNIPPRTFRSVDAIRTFFLQNSRLPTFEEAQSIIKKPRVLTPARWSELVNAFRCSSPFADEVSEFLPAVSDDLDTLVDGGDDV